MNIDCKKPPLCDPAIPPKEIYPPATAPFSFCVGGKTIHWDGTRLRFEPGVRVADGTYDTVTVVDGCIVGYGYAAEATYTPPYCNPNPGDCQGSPPGGSPTPAPTVRVNPDPSNLLRDTSQGLLAKVVLNGGDGIRITGSGVATNPYVITATDSGGGRTIVGRNGIQHTNDTNGNVYLELTKTGVTRGLYNGITVDEYGRITDITPGAGEINVSTDASLTAQQQGDDFVIGHPKHLSNLPDLTARFGGYNVTLNESGHIVHMERDSNVAEGIYELGAYRIGLERSGNITSIAQNPDVPSAPGAFSTVDGKTISYDATGRITSVEGAALGSATPPLPLRDMYRLVVTLNPTTATVEKEVYGQDITIAEITPTTVVLSLPAYVVDAAQVNVHGSLNGSVDILQRRLELTYTYGGGSRDGQVVITVSLRG